LLDTCVLSEMTKTEPDVKVVRWLRHVDDSALFVSVLTLGELDKGICRLRQGSRRRELEDWFGGVREAYASRVFGVTIDIALEWGRVSARAESRGKTLPVADALIGATALVHELSVVTRNVEPTRGTGA